MIMKMRIYNKMIKRIYLERANNDRVTSLLFLEVIQLTYLFLIIYFMSLVIF